MLPYSRIATTWTLFAAANSFGGELAIKLQDVICVPGKQASLTAEVARSLTLSLKDGKSNVEVEFFADGRSLGRAWTNDKGIAVLQVNPGRVRSSTYAASAFYKRRMLTGEGRWFTWNPNRTIVAVDIDDTVCWTNYGDLFISDHDHVSKPLDGAGEALNQISKRFHVLYISARPLWLTEKTQQWLDDNGFPAGPVVHRGGWESCLRQRAVKQEILADLRQFLPNLLVGIADRQVDIRAFGSADMITMLVRNHQLASSRTRVIGFQDWNELGRYIADNEAGFSDAGSLAKAIASNELPPVTPVIERFSEAIKQSLPVQRTVSATAIR